MSVILGLTSCSNSDTGGGGGDAASTPEAEATTASADGFDEAAVVEVLRPAWPNASDDELAEKAQVFRDYCTMDLGDATARAIFAGVLETNAALLEAGCPDRVAAFRADG